MRLRACSAVWLALLFLVACTGAWGQTSRSGTGTVTGHVICQDTQKPARFANVILFRVPGQVTPTPNTDGTDQRAKDAAFKAMMEEQYSATVVQAQTGIDGGFVATNVPPGDYYALAAAPGYVQPRNVVQAAYDAGEDLTKSISGVSMVHVSADRSSQTEITATRGAAVEGHVLWDDGSPVSDATVSVESATKKHKTLPPQFGMIMGFSMFPPTPGLTDDRGHYRLSGLAPGEYRVKATLPMNSHMTFSRGVLVGLGQLGTLPMTVYAPASFHQADAKTVTLTAGEERTDQDITYNLNGLHTVSGQVISAEDHHGLNRGVVTLTDANDKTFARSASVDPNGNFTVTFVPAGTYTMTVGNAADTVTEEPKKPEFGGLVTDVDKTVRTYQKGELQVMVGDSDVSGQNIELKPEKAGQEAAGSGADQEHVVAETGH